jgi:hypothetical protein
VVSPTLARMGVVRPWHFVVLLCCVAVVAIVVGVVLLIVRATSRSK